MIVVEAHRSRFVVAAQKARSAVCNKKDPAPKRGGHVAFGPAALHHADEIIRRIICSMLAWRPRMYRRRLYD
jgi:hypothetical protein